MADDDTKKHKKVYARGYYDGLIDAGVSNLNDWKFGEKTMLSQARYRALSAGLTQAAAKVFEAVPITAPMRANQVHAELVRAGKGRDLSHTEGCLSSLVGIGLVKEPTRGEFIRVPVRNKGEPVPALKSIPQSKPAPTVTEEEVMSAIQKVDKEDAPKKNPIDALGAIAARARETASALQSLATEIDAAALEAEAYLESVDKDTKRLRQLQEILKGLGS